MFTVDVVFILPQALKDFWAKFARNHRFLRALAADQVFVVKVLDNLVTASVATYELQL